MRIGTMKNVKEVVRKALLNNGTKDDMYKDIVAEFGCSRHAAKVLLHSFIWECSEAYMQSVITEGLDMSLPERFKEETEDSSIKLNTLYIVETIGTGEPVGTILIESGCNGKFIGYGEANAYSAFSTAHWIVENDGYIQVNGKNTFKLKM